MPVGIIAEYNPLHNGHLYQIRKARDMAREAGISDPRIVVCMSGSFVQRGTPAILDKSLRTHLALQAGASLVLELPSLYATATAEWFAFGGISLLLRSGIVDALSFGVENISSIEILREAADLLAENPPQYTELLRQHLDQGLAFAPARQKALETCLGKELPISSNQILTLEYLRAISRLCSSEPVSEPSLFPIERIGTGHDSSEAEGNYASASLIRKHIYEGDLCCLDHWVPSFTEDVLRSMKGSPVSEEDLFPALRYRLACHTPETLSAIDEIAEGLENRILKASETASTYAELLSMLQTKRYPTSRLRRILLNIYLDITSEKKKALHFTSGPAYIRVLGCRTGCEDLLARMSAESSLPMIVRPARDISSLKEPAYQAFSDEIRYTHLYHSLVPSSPVSDLSMPLIRE